MARMKKRYCIECDARRSYKTKNRLVDFTVHDIVITYPEIFAYCKECGTEMYVPEINDMNVRARETAVANSKHTCDGCRYLSVDKIERAYCDSPFRHACLLSSTRRFKEGE